MITKYVFPISYCSGLPDERVSTTFCLLQRNMTRPGNYPKIAIFTIFQKILKFMKWHQNSSNLKGRQELKEYDQENN